MTPAQRRYLYTLAVFSLIVFGAFITLISVSLNQMASELSLSLAQLGVLPFVRGIGLVATVLLLGFLASRFGKKPFVILGLFLVFLFGLSLVFARSYPVLLPLFALLGVGLGCIEALINPLTAELFP